MCTFILCSVISWFLSLTWIKPWCVPFRIHPHLILTVISNWKRLLLQTKNSWWCTSYKHALCVRLLNTMRHKLLVIYQKRWICFDNVWIKEDGPAVWRMKLLDKILSKYFLIWIFHLVSRMTFLRIFDLNLSKNIENYFCRWIFLVNFLVFIKVVDNCYHIGNILPYKLW